MDDIRHRRTYQTPKPTDHDYNRQSEETSESSHTLYNTSDEQLSDDVCEISQDTTKKSVHVPMLAGLFFFLVSAVFISRFYFSQRVETHKECSFNGFEQQFPGETPRVWSDLTVGIENILNNQTLKPAVYLFLHTDKQYLRHMVKAVAEKTSTCFENAVKPVEMLSDEFIKDRDFGHIIESFKIKIEQSRVVIIANLNEIPADAARALHHICDTENPIKKDVVVYLTLVPLYTDGNSHSNAMNTLSSLWNSTLRDNELDPLITRVCDEVIKLQG